jgi:hypothetical protein
MAGPMKKRAPLERGRMLGSIATQLNESVIYSHCPLPMGEGFV